MEKIVKLVRLIADGRHNAFPSIIRFKGDLYLTYRTSDGHACCNGVIVLMRSKDDGETWEKIASPYEGGRNWYEGFLAELNGRLFMYAGSFAADKPVLTQLNSQYVSYSDDGEKWSIPQQAIGGHKRFWRPRNINGRLYAGAYCLLTREHVDEAGVFPPEDFEGDLAVSDDGLHWEIVSALSRNESGNETEIFYDEEENLLHAYIRRENCPGTLAIRKAAYPFTQWSDTVDFGEALQGVCVKKCHGRLFMFGRRRESSTNMGTIYYDRNKISFRGYVCIPELGRWFDYVTMPGSQDCSYPEILELPDDRMLIAYYSQHAYEGSDINSAADIYLATVRCDGEPDVNLKVAGMLRKKGII